MRVDAEDNLLYMMSLSQNVKKKRHEGNSLLIIALITLFYRLCDCNEISQTSDLRLCYDSNCETVISEVEAIGSYATTYSEHLKFRRGARIRVTSKSAGIRTDLWGGYIDKKFGYFPKSFVKELTVYKRQLRHYVKIESKVADVQHGKIKGHPSKTKAEQEKLQKQTNGHDSNVNINLQKSGDIETESVNKKIEQFTDDTEVDETEIDENVDEMEKETAMGEENVNKSTLNDSDNGDDSDMTVIDEATNDTQLESDSKQENGQDSGDVKQQPDTLQFKISDIKQETGNTKQETDDTKHETGDIKQETGDTKQETDSTKQETGDIKQETSDTKHETGDIKQDTGNTKQETGDIKQETDDTKQETGDTKQETGDIKQEIGDTKQVTGDIKHETGDTKQESGDIKQKADDTKQETGDIKQKADDIEHETGDIKQERGDTEQDTSGTKQQRGSLQSKTTGDTKINSGQDVLQKQDDPKLVSPKVQINLSDYRQGDVHSYHKQDIPRGSNDTTSEPAEIGHNSLNYSIEQHRDQGTRSNELDPSVSQHSNDIVHEPVGQTASESSNKIDQQNINIADSINHNVNSSKQDLDQIKDNITLRNDSRVNDSPQRDVQKDDMNMEKEVHKLNLIEKAHKMLKKRLQETVSPEDDEIANLNRWLKEDLSDTSVDTGVASDNTVSHDETSLEILGLNQESGTPPLSSDKSDGIAVGSTEGEQSVEEMSSKHTFQHGVKMPDPVNVITDNTSKDKVIVSNIGQSSGRVPDKSAQIETSIVLPDTVGETTPESVHSKQNIISSPVQHSSSSHHSVALDSAATMLADTDSFPISDITNSPVQMPGSDELSLNNHNIDSSSTILATSSMQNVHASLQPSVNQADAKVTGRQIPSPYLDETNNYFDTINVTLTNVDNMQPVYSEPYNMQFVSRKTLSTNDRVENQELTDKDHMHNEVGKSAEERHQNENVGGKAENSKKEAMDKISSGRPELKEMLENMVVGTYSGQDKDKQKIIKYDKTHEKSDTGGERDISVSKTETSTTINDASPGTPITEQDTQQADHLKSYDSNGVVQEDHDVNKSIVDKDDEIDESNIVTDQPKQLFKPEDSIKKLTAPNSDISDNVLDEKLQDKCTDSIYSDDSKEKLGYIAFFTPSFLTNLLSGDRNSSSLVTGLMATTTILTIILVNMCFRRSSQDRRQETASVIRKLESSIFVMTKEKEVLENSLSEMEQRVNQFKGDLVSSENNLTIATSAIQNLTLNNQTLQTNYDEISTEYERTRNELTNVITLIADKDILIDSLKKDLVKSDEIMKDTIIKYETCCRELGETQADLDLVRAKDEQLVAQIDHLETRKQQLLEEGDVYERRVQELSDMIDSLQRNNEDIRSSLAFKDQELVVLHDCFTQLKAFEAENPEEGAFINSQDIKVKLSEMTDVSKVKAVLNATEIERDTFQSKLQIEIDARRELEDQVASQKKELDEALILRNKFERQSIESHTKLSVLTSYFKEKEVELQNKLGEHEALKKHSFNLLESADEKTKTMEQQLQAASERVRDLESEIVAQEKDFRTQIAANEKKAHENWLAARAAERESRELKQELSIHRDRLLEAERHHSDTVIRPLPTRLIPHPDVRNIPPPPFTSGVPHYNDVSIDRPPSFGSFHDEEQRMAPAEPFTGPLGQRRMSSPPQSFPTMSPSPVGDNRHFYPHPISIDGQPLPPNIPLSEIRNLRPGHPVHNNIPEFVGMPQEVHEPGFPREPLPLGPMPPRSMHSPPHFDRGPPLHDIRMFPPFHGHMGMEHPRPPFPLRGPPPGPIIHDDLPHSYMGDLPHSYIGGLALPHGMRPLGPHPPGGPPPRMFGSEMKPMYRSDVPRSTANDSSQGSLQSQV